MKYFRFIKALIWYIIWGNPVSYHVYLDRLNKCNHCKHRCDEKCCKCGCYIRKKANWSTESCPLKKW